MNSRKRNNIRQITRTGILICIIIILGSTPLGMIPLPWMNATILHLPVIIGTILFGLRVGLISGLAFGIISLVKAYTQPTPVSIFFIDPMVSILPRVCIPIVVYFIYKLIKNKNLSVIISAFFGSLTNTILVLGSILLLYNSEISKVFGDNANLPIITLGSIAFVNGIPEAIIVTILSFAIIKATNKKVG